MSSVLRALDANANRAREAMRVMEDAARFVLDDQPLTRDIKRLRHDLAAALRALSLPLELSRDTPGDVGTAISVTSERSRAGVQDVAVAAGKRLGEALRVLEEFGKVVSPAFGAAVEQMRYRGYTLEKLLHERLGAPAARQWKLCLVLSEALCSHHPWHDVARASLDAGADCIQLREKSLDDGELLARAQRLVKLARDASRSCAVIINDRPDIALLSGADGVHVGEFDLPPNQVRQLAGRRLIVGASTHNLAEARAAVAAGVDYCGVGAIFPTTTKQRTPSGLKYLRQFLRHFPNLPHLAIGGVSPDNAAEIAAAGGRGLAVSSAVCSAKKPRAVVKRLLRAMRSR